MSPSADLATSDAGRPDAAGEKGIVDLISHDAGACRRGLREISEIAAVASLEDSQMSPQEALATIAAIAEWVDDEESGERADCSAVIQDLNALTGSVDIESLDDRAAFDLFARVLSLLRR